MITPYAKEVERQMQRVYTRLSERDRRLYAAVEALKLAHGGLSYIARLLGCSPITIRQGLKELRSDDLLEPGRDRKVGGGRKRALETVAGIDEAFLAIVRDHTAGDPMKGEVKWTHLSLKEIGQRLDQRGIKVSRKIVKQLLKKHGYRRRKALKKKATGTTKGRNEQFERIGELRADYQARGLPLISVDTKKKESLGDLFRPGWLYTQEVIEVFDHDYSHLAEGVAIPHTIYDLTHNSAYVNIGTSHDTGEFACDSIRRWWYRRGRYDYPEADALLLLVDAGGSNSYRQHLFKQELQRLVDTIGIEIRVAHYPSYASKWNPVEHRVFPHITRALQGVILTSHELVKGLIEKTTTATGLKVRASIIDKVYQTGRQVTKDFKDTTRIVFDEVLGKWNYVVSPLQTQQA